MNKMDLYITLDGIQSVRVFCSMDTFLATTNLVFHTKNAQVRESDLESVHIVVHLSDLTYKPL